MSGLIIESVSSENLATQFIPFVEGNSADGVQGSIDPCDQYNHNSFKKWQLVLNTPNVCGDAKPPLRLCNVPPPKTGPEILANLDEKQRQTSLRRDQHMTKVIQRSRKYSEKVLQVRQKMANKQAEFSQNIENMLQEKRRIAERLRERISQSKLDRIRTHIEHAKLVRNRKMANNDQCSSNSGSLAPSNCLPYSTVAFFLTYEAGSLLIHDVTSCDNWMAKATVNFLPSLQEYTIPGEGNHEGKEKSSVETPPPEAQTEHTDSPTCN